MYPDLLKFCLILKFSKDLGKEKGNLCYDVFSMSRSLQMVVLARLGR